MDLKAIVLKKKNVRQRQIPYITYMWNLKKYNKLVHMTKKKQTHRYREYTSGYQWGEGRGKRCNIGVED